MQQLSTDKIAFSQSQIFHTKEICSLLSIINPTNFISVHNTRNITFLSADLR